jgi:hypothetical protein
LDGICVCVRVTVVLVELVEAEEWDPDDVNRHHERTFRGDESEQAKDMVCWWC